jgi:cobyrinic acid a,c-diamide synthase
MQTFAKKVPGVIIAGLRGGSGKTVISLGICAAWKEKGLKVSPFKKGPDYIDAGWLARAAGNLCYNLDTYLCTPESVLDTYKKRIKDFDVAVVEGNRGLYDGIDTDGSTSTAEIAKLLNLPVVIVLDCTKATRTLAAMIFGCMQFDPDLKICGVILNRVAGKRHEEKVRINIEKFCKIPVFGAIPRLDNKLEDGAFPERHMGLVTAEEHLFSQNAVLSAFNFVRDNIDLDRLYNEISKEEYLSTDVNNISGALPAPPAIVNSNPFLIPKVKIAVIRDSAFQFYYPDNIEALQNAGADIAYISPLKDSTIPDVHGIYMGGGFPETHALQLSQNKQFRESLKNLSQKGLPIYAECGGLIFLGESLMLDGKEYPMTGVFPIKFGLCKRPQGHGYTEVEIVNDSPFFKTGEIIKGHEFRYSSVISIDYQNNQMAFKMLRGKGIIDHKDGFVLNNTLGTYTHIHALGIPSWGTSFVLAAVKFRETGVRSYNNDIVCYPL